MTSYEVKKENQDSLFTSQYLHLVESRKDPIREGLRLLYSKEKQIEDSCLQYLLINSLQKKIDLPLSVFFLNNNHY